MIVSTVSGSRRDTGLECLNCGNLGLWQPEESDPCAGDWWCPLCKSWSAGYRKLSHAGTTVRSGRLVWICSGKPVENIIFA